MKPCAMISRLDDHESNKTPTDQRAELTVEIFAALDEPNNNGARTYSSQRHCECVIQGSIIRLCLRRTLGPHRAIGAATSLCHMGAGLWTLSTRT